MFYNLHSDAIIGYKKLSDAELGMSSGNQTHIGLFENTLKFASSEHQISTSQLIYHNKLIETETYLNYIKNPNGSFRSPKIRSAELGSKSTVRVIREIAIQQANINWYLMWFGLENENLIFLLIEENSSDYHYLFNLLGNLNKGHIEQTDIAFNASIQFLNNKVNNLNFNYFQELEIFAQTNEYQNIKKINPKRYDIEKAQKLFQKIGRNGEELVNQYLEQEKYKKNIKSFTWVNKTSESGFPFDFEIKDTQNNTIYSDAKSTSYKFEQKIIFSSQELKFIQQNNNYLIHRVFNLNETPKLQICNNISDISYDFVNNLKKFNQDIAQSELQVNSMKVSIKPTSKLLHFSQEISL